MSKHTPGPWSVYMGRVVGHITHNGALAGALQTDVAKMLAVGETAEANAKLIAAAPDLLEALQAMLDRYADDASLDSPIDEAARAALVKATGVKS